MNNLIYRKVYKDEVSLLDQIYRLRYQVYAREFGYIEPRHYPDGRETDQYDDQAQHFAAIDPNGEVVGAARLILPGEHDLPLETKCQLSYNPKRLFPHTRFAEMSRLVVNQNFRTKKEFKRLCRENHTQQGVADDSPQRIARCIAKCITIGLCSCVYEESRRMDITHWYALMEKKLFVLLTLYGFKFYCIGAGLNFMGTVYPYVVTMSDIDRSVKSFVFRYACPILQPHVVPRLERGGWFSLNQGAFPAENRIF